MTASTQHTRDAILARLRSGPKTQAPESDFAVMDRPERSQDDRFAQFKSVIEGVHGEVHETTEALWPDLLSQLIAQNGWTSLAYGPKGPHGAEIEKALEGKLTLLPFDKSYDEVKEALFDTQVGFTSTIGAAAETGSLMLWPGPNEPRTLSLAPDVHVALLRKSEIKDTLYDLVCDPTFNAQTLPTNVVVVSGPSKTADIEQTLVFGVHGPRRLIVLAVE